MTTPAGNTTTAVIALDSIASGTYSYSCSVGTFKMSLSISAQFIAMNGGTADSIDGTIVLQTYSYCLPTVAPAVIQVTGINAATNVSCNLPNGDQVELDVASFQFNSTQNTYSYLATLTYNPVATQKYWYAIKAGPIMSSQLISGTLLNVSTAREYAEQVGKAFAQAGLLPPLSGSQK